jgi:hypothetical protein
VKFPFIWSNIPTAPAYGVYTCISKVCLIQINEQVNEKWAQFVPRCMPIVCRFVPSWDIVFTSSLTILFHDTQLD